MKFPSGIVASWKLLLRRRRHQPHRSQRRQGHHRRQSSPFGYDGLVLTGHIDGDAIEYTATGKMPFQFPLEADHMAECIRKNKTPKTLAGELGLMPISSPSRPIYKAVSPIA